MTSGAGLPYRLLVPATLLDRGPGAAGRIQRTVRDWFVDVAFFLVAAVVAVVFYFSSIQGATESVSTPMRAIDIVFGLVACLSIWGRRRFPVAVGVLTALLATLSVSAGAAAGLAQFTVSVHRRTSVAVALTILNIACSTVLTIIRPQDMSFLTSTIINASAGAIFLAWGLFVRARRQLVLTLRERAERAEAEQRILADQARLAERTRIAREMHDVLAHRISLMALHAGGLQVRPDVGEVQVRETAGLLRATAQQALDELRGVIGVLRDELGGAESPSAPQPTLRDIARLVDDSRRAGAKIEFTMDVPPDAEPPGSLGRDAYRVVQEALTNVAKHATGTATSVQVVGEPGGGLTVDVRNRLPLASATEPPGSKPPGSGNGLLGLAERVTLAGGTFEHGPNDAGEFVVDARLAW